MRNLDIIESYTKLQEELMNMKPLPAKVIYAIVRNTNMLLRIVADIEQARYKIVHGYGILDEKDLSKFTIPPQNMKAVNQELTNLQDTDTNIDLMYINLADIENVEFTPVLMDALMFMIKEG